MILIQNFEGLSLLIEGFLSFFVFFLLSDFNLNKKMSNTTYSTTSYEKLLSACGGALVTSLMVTPMDVIKMRLQTQHVYTPHVKATCCLTFDRCTLTQAIKTTKRNFSHLGKVQVANLHECALHSPKNPELFKGTFVSKKEKQYCISQNLRLFF